MFFPFLAHCLRFPAYPFQQVAPAVLKDDGFNCAIRSAAKKSMEDFRLSHIDQERPESDDDDNNNDDNDGDDDDENDEQYEKFLHVHQTRAKTLLLDMRSKISDVVLRIASMVMFKLLPIFMSGVVVHPAHIDMLKRVHKSNPNVPMIFLPLHRSHLDYIMVTFIMYNNQIHAPLVAAGDNLRIPFFG